MASAAEPAGGAHYDQAFYEGYSGRFNQYWWARRFYAKLILRYRTSGTLLEVGCGLGHVLMRLQDRFDATGIDVSEFALAKARQNAPRARLLPGTAEDLGGLTGPFDAIAAFHVVEHLADPAAVLHTWAQATRPGGLLVFATPNPDAPLAHKKGDRWYGITPEHIALYSPQEWARLTRDAGYRIKKVIGDGMWDVPYVPYVPAPLQLAVFGLPCALQTVSAVPFIPVRWGEATIIVAERT